MHLILICVKGVVDYCVISMCYDAICVTPGENTSVKCVYKGGGGIYFKTFVSRVTFILVVDCSIGFKGEHCPH